MWLHWFILVIVVMILAIFGFMERDYLLQKFKSMKKKPFEKGDNVFVSDLILSPQYNNLIGVIASDLDPKKKRFAIKILYQEKYITVKPENMSFLTKQKQIESILRNIGINQKSKYSVNSSDDFIKLLSTKYRSCSLPPLNQFFNSSFKHYQENCDSVYCVIQYLSLFSSIGKYHYFNNSFWTKYIDEYTASNKLRLFSQIDNHQKHGNYDDVDRERLSLTILFLEFFNHKMCIIKYNEQFRIIQSFSDICKYSLIQELNERKWLNVSSMEHFCDALIDVIYCKKLNRSKWIFGDEIEDTYFNENQSFKICVMEDLNVEMFIKSANKMLKYVAKFDNQITIKCV